jgi:hypothetical protein
MRDFPLTTPAFVGRPPLVSKVCCVALWMLFGSVLLNFNTAKAQTPSERGEIAHDLIGSWQTTLDVPAFGATITGLSSFMPGGIVFETDTPSATELLGQSTVLSNGHGVWKPTGNGTFSYTFIKEIYPAVSGFSIPVGQAKSDIKAAVSKDGNKLTITDVTITFTDTNGNVFFTATATGTATRIAIN